MNPLYIPFLLSTGLSVVLVGGGWNAFSLSAFLFLSASASRTCINSHSLKVSFIWFRGPRKNPCWGQLVTCSPDMYICILQLYVWSLNISWYYHLCMYVPFSALSSLLLSPSPSENTHQTPTPCPPDGNAWMCVSEYMYCYASHNLSPSQTHLAFWLGGRKGSVVLFLPCLPGLPSLDIAFFKLGKETVPGLVGQCRVLHQLSFDH